MFNWFGTSGARTDIDVPGEPNPISATGVIVPLKENRPGQYIIGYELPPGNTNCCGATKILTRGDYSEKAVCHLLLLFAKSITIFTTPYGVERGIIHDLNHRIINYRQVLENACVTLNKLADKKAVWEVVELDAYECVVLMRTELLSAAYNKLIEEMKGKLQ